MLQKLSYFNLALAVIYFLEYLQNSSRPTVGGLLAVVVFNWMVLRNLEREQFRWTGLQWVVAIVTLGFALYTGYAAVLLVQAAVKYQYASAGLLLQVFCGLLFAISLLYHLYLSKYAFYSKKDEQPFDN